MGWKIDTPEACESYSLDTNTEFEVRRLLQLPIRGVSSERPPDSPQFLSLQPFIPLDGGLVRFSKPEVSKILSISPILSKASRSLKRIVLSSFAFFQVSACTPYGSNMCVEAWGRAISAVNEFVTAINITRRRSDAMVANSFSDRRSTYPLIIQQHEASSDGVSGQQ